MRKFKNNGWLLLATVFMVIATITISLVSCNSEITEIDNEATVSFAPSVTKSLNQSGTIQSTANENVSLYRWEYAVSTELITDENYSSLTWHEFEDIDGNGTTTRLESGLGTIRGLTKHSSYAFALKGYTTGTDGELMWEGKTDQLTKLDSKKQKISITVDPKGKGNLYFNITAPVYDLEEPNTSDTDKFVITASKINTSNNTTTYEKLSVLNDDNDTYYLDTVTSKSPEKLAAGTYFVTVEQQTYNEGTYSTIAGRKQVLIVDIYSGVDTVIAGSLDSTGLVDFTFDDDYGLTIDDWIVEGSINNFNLEAWTNDKSEKMYIRQNDRVYVYDKDFLILDFSAAEEDYKIYVNGCEVLLNDATITDDYFGSVNFYKKSITSDEGEEITELSYLSEYDSENKTIKAWGKNDNDYLVTVTSGKLSMTFTIVGRTEAKNTGTGITTYTEQQLINRGDNIINIVYESNLDKVNDIDFTSGIKASSALNILYDILGDMTSSTDATKNTMTLTLSVIEESATQKTAKYQISLKADVECLDANGNVIDSKSKIIHEVDDYVTIIITIPSGLKDMAVTHYADTNNDDIEDTVIELTSTTDIANATSDDKYAGFFKHVMNDSSDTTGWHGKLYIKTKSFSPFTSTYIYPEKYFVTFMVSSGTGYTVYSHATVFSDECVSAPWKASDSNTYKWYKDKARTTAWDFVNDKVTSDITLYGTVDKSGGASSVCTYITHHASSAKWQEFKVTITGISGVTTWDQMLVNKASNGMTSINANGTWNSDTSDNIYFEIGNVQYFLYTSKNVLVKTTDAVVASNAANGYYLRSSFTVNLNKNLSTCTTEVSPITAIDGLAIGTLPSTMENSNYDNDSKHFEGWYYSTQFKDEQVVTASTIANRYVHSNLYAKWTGPKVIFHDYNYQDEDKIVYLDKLGDCLGDKYIYPSTGVYEGSILIGSDWHDADGNYYYSDTPITNNVTNLYAYWHCLDYETTFYFYNVTNSLDYNTDEVDTCFSTFDQLKEAYNYHSGTKEKGKLYLDWYNSHYDCLTEESYTSGDRYLTKSGVSYWIEYRSSTDLGGKVYPVLANNYDDSEMWLYITIPEGKTFTGVTIAPCDGGRNLNSEGFVNVTSATDKQHAVVFENNYSEYVIMYPTYEITGTIVYETLNPTTPTDSTYSTFTQETTVITSGPVLNKLDSYKVTKDGYKFDGWYSNNAYSSGFGTISPLYNDFTVYARYLPQYNLTFVTSGERVLTTGDYSISLTETAPQKYTYLGCQTLPGASSKMEYTYYGDQYYSTFTGWNFDAFNEVNMEFASEGPYSFTSIPSDAYGDKTLYSVWKWEQVHYFN